MGLQRDNIPHFLRAMTSFSHMYFVTIHFSFSSQMWPVLYAVVSQFAVRFQELKCRERHVLVNKSFHWALMHWLEPGLQENCMETLVLCRKPGRGVQDACKMLLCFSQLWTPTQGQDWCLWNYTPRELESLICIVLLHVITSQVPFFSRVKQCNLNCFSMFPAPTHNVSGPVGEDEVQQMVS